MDTLVISLRSWKHLYLLLKLAEIGAHKRTAKISTEYLAQKIGVSQQTASRNLIELERENLIKRTVTPKGCLIKLTDKGIMKLRALYSKLRLIMEAAYPPSLTLEGTVFTGLGEGAYYVSLDQYRKQFIEKLGFDPFPGTLNLKLTTEYDIKTRQELEAYPGIEIHGFKNETRTYGSGKCYPAIINNKVKGAVVFAFRTHYDHSVIEIIAPMSLRKRLKLKDGQRVKVEILTLP